MFGGGGGVPCLTPPRDTGPKGTPFAFPVVFTRISVASLQEGAVSRRQGQDYPGAASSVSAAVGPDDAAGLELVWIFSPRACTSVSL